MSSEKKERVDCARSMDQMFWYLAQTPIDISKMPNHLLLRNRKHRVDESE